MCVSRVKTKTKSILFTRVSEISSCFPCCRWKQCISLKIKVKRYKTSRNISKMWFLKNFKKLEWTSVARKEWKQSAVVERRRTSARESRRDLHTGNKGVDIGKRHLGEKYETEGIRWVINIPVRTVNCQKSEK